MVQVKTIFHLIAATQFWWGCYYDWFYVYIPEQDGEIGTKFMRTTKLRFLTYWNALLQSVFYTICLIEDLSGDGSIGLAMKKLKNAMITCLAFPLSMFVALTFWGLYAIDRELVLPKILDSYFPAWLNHVMHTNIAVCIVIELYITYRKYPSRRRGLSVLLTFMSIYLIWIHIIHSHTNIWVYPVLRVLNLPLRLIFFLSLFGLGTSLYIFGEKLNSFIWKRMDLSKL